MKRNRFTPDPTPEQIFLKLFLGALTVVLLSVGFVLTVLFHSVVSEAETHGEDGLTHMFLKDEQ